MATLRDVVRLLPVKNIGYDIIVVVIGESVYHGQLLRHVGGRWRVTRFVTPCEEH